MRTTIEITDAQRAKLLELAARRGEKGFSRLVQEALESYLADERARQEKVREALAVIGRLSDEAAERMERDIRALRERWR